MLFNTLEYACFLLVVVLVHHFLPARHQPWLLLLASYVFYARWNAVFLPLVVGLTVLNYALALGLARLAAGARASAALAAGVALNLAVLAYFKYAGFILRTATQALGAMGVARAPAPFSILVPLGISFYVFEFIHYLVDVGRGRPPVRSLLRFALFAAFFPTQIAGPIKRYEQFVPQIDQHPHLDRARAGAGLRLLLSGLFKKAALADNLAPVVAVGFARVAPGNVGLGMSEAWLVVLAFAMQIYWDFSGYTDMGRGSAILLGYDVPENFRRPYLATNVADFWRRWHISLSSWLRDYVYIPLGGRRRSRYRNLFLTMLLGGLWHGANWTFVVWGGLHGALLAAYRRWTPSRPPAPPADPAMRSRPSRAGRAVIGWALTMTAVCVAWVFFRAPSLGDGLAMLGAMAGGHSGGARALSQIEHWFVVIVVVGGLAVELAAERPLRWGPRWAAGGRALRPAFYVLLLILTLLMKPDSEPPFIYFRF
jgi:D-alanyl-lipoteichoic acid acyltransferase DltB (MBOAT superfamily)